MYKTEKNKTLKKIILSGLASHFSKEIIPYLFEEMKINMNNDIIEWLYVIHKVNEITHPELKEWERNIVKNEELMRKIRLDGYNQRNFNKANRQLTNVISKKDNVKIGRNDPCPCGSGKKYKRCCMNK